MDRPAHLIAEMLVNNVEGMDDDVNVMAREGDLILYSFPQQAGRSRLEPLFSDGQSPGSPVGRDRSVSWIRAGSTALLTWLMASGASDRAMRDVPGGRQPCVTSAPGRSRSDRRTEPATKIRCRDRASPWRRRRPRRLGGASLGEPSEVDSEEYVKRGVIARGLPISAHCSRFGRMKDASSRTPRSEQLETRTSRATKRLTALQRRFMTGFD